MPVPLTGGRELDVVLSHALDRYGERTADSERVRPRSACPEHLGIRTASGVVWLVFDRGRPARPAAFAATLSGRRIRAGNPPRATCLRLVSVDGRLDPPV